MREKLWKLSWESIRRSRHWSVAEGSWVVAELQSSGLSAMQFAELHQLPVTRVYHWCSRLQGDERRQTAERVATPRLLEVKLPAGRDRTFNADRIEIELHSGRRLSVPEGMSLERLSALVTLLERS
jgi:hypothetical protein